MEILLCVVVVGVVWLFVWPNKSNSEDFPYPDECWDCKRGNCNGCIVHKRR